MNKKSFNTILLVLGMVTVGQFTAGVYLPSMPHIAGYFQTTAGRVQLTLTMYYLSYGLSQFIYGPLADLFGRRPISIISLVIFLIGSLFALLSMQIDWLIFGCFLQGLGIGSCGMMGRTVPRDLYSGKKLVSVNAWINVLIVFTPLIAPVFGGYIQTHLGWRANFACILIYAAIIFFLILFRLPETNPQIRKVDKPLLKILQAYHEIFTHRRFIIGMLCSLLAFASLPAYEIVGAFLFQNVLGLSPVAFGWIMIIPFLGYIIGSVLADKLQHIFSFGQLMTAGNLIMMISSVVMLILGLLHFVNLWVILIPITIFFAGTGIIIPLAVSDAMTPFTVTAGIAGAILGGTQNLGGALAAGLLSRLPHTNQISLAAVLLGLGLLSYLTGLFGHNNT